MAQTQAAPQSGRLLAALQVAGVILSGWWVWLHSILPRLRWESLASLAGEAMGAVAIAWLAGGLLTFCIYMVVALDEVRDTTRFSMRSSAPAMWFAPAIILLSAPFAAAFVVSLVLITYATRLLVAQWVGIESPIRRLEPVQGGNSFLFDSSRLEGAVFRQDRGWVLACSLTAQVGVVALLWHHPLRAAACLATSTGILTSLAIVTGAYRPARLPGLPSSLLSVPMTFLLAAALSFGGIVVGRGYAGGSASAAGTDTNAGNQAATRPVSDTDPRRDEGDAFGGDFPGVVLLPELKPHVLLVPVPTSPAVFSAALTRPVGIAFSGEYWLFRPPRTRPPLRSFIRRGNPAEISFHTTDGTPLNMEAHQKLDPPVELRCCSGIQLALSNTDHSPGAISVELILIDNEPVRSQFASLGAVALESSATFSQTLNFAIPHTIDLWKFDEFRVVFHRDIIRMDRSAKIAIERFVLVP